MPDMKILREKIILLKFVDKVSFHLSHPQSKSCKFVSRLEVNGWKLYAYFIYCFHSVVTTFSNFQATSLPLVYPKVFGIFTPNFTTKLRKIWLNFSYTKIKVGWKKWGGDYVNCGPCHALLNSVDTAQI